MERMEVECAGGGAGLRRANSAPLLANLSESSAIFQPCGSRCRRSSVSVNLACPGLPFPLSTMRTTCHRCQTGSRQQEGLTDVQLRHMQHSREAPASLLSSTSWHSAYDLPQCLHNNGGSPDSSPVPSPGVDRTGSRLGLQPSPLSSLKRKGGVEVDSPPNKLFVAGVPSARSLDMPILNSPECASIATIPGNVLLGCSSSAEFSPTPGSPITVTVTLPASPTMSFLLTNSHPSGL